jgi:leucyl aminopeptidase
MKLSTALTLGAAVQLSSAAAVPQQVPLGSHPLENTQLPSEKYLIELAPYQTRWVTEEEKWELKLVRLDDCDILNPANPPRME